MNFRFPEIWEKKKKKKFGARSYLLIYLNKVFEAYLLVVVEANNKHFKAKNSYNPQYHDYGEIYPI